jgi:hypothetical protein
MNELRIFDRSSSVKFVFDIVRLIEMKVVSLADFDSPIGFGICLMTPKVLEELSAPETSFVRVNLAVARKIPSRCDEFFD